MNFRRVLLIIGGTIYYGAVAVAVFFAILYFKNNYAATDYPETPYVATQEGLEDISVALLPELSFGMSKKSVTKLFGEAEQTKSDDSKAEEFTCLYVREISGHEANIYLTFKQIGRRERLYKTIVNFRHSAATESLAEEIIKQEKLTFEQKDGYYYGKAEGLVTPFDYEGRFTCIGAKDGNININLTVAISPAGVSLRTLVADDNLYGTIDDITYPDGLDEFFTSVTQYFEGMAYFPLFSREDFNSITIGQTTKEELLTKLPDAIYEMEQGISCWVVYSSKKGGVIRVEIDSNGIVSDIDWGNESDVSSE